MAVVRGLVFPDAKGGVEQLPHDGDEGLAWATSAVDELLVEGSDSWVVLGGDQSRHVEGLSEDDIAVLGDPSRLVAADVDSWLWVHLLRVQLRMHVVEYPPWVISDDDWYG